MLSQSINPRCSIGFIRLKHRIGPETDRRRKARIVANAELMGVPVNAAKQRVNATRSASRRDAAR